MEHSLLHGLQLTGLLVALGGPWFVLAFLRPSRKRLGSHASVTGYGDLLEAKARQWVSYGATAAAVAAVFDLFVQTAELQGTTLFAGIDPQLAWQLATETGIGQFWIVKILALVGTAVVVRFSFAWSWWLTGGLALMAVIATSLVSHAAAQPVGRSWPAAIQVIHLTGASAWLGVLTHLLLARRSIESATRADSFALTAELVRRFSPWALTAVGLLLLSGFLSAARFLGNASALVTSAYGLTLLIKIALVAVAFFAGFKNFRVIRPCLISLARQAEGALGSKASGNAEASRNSLLKQFGRFLELELSAGLLVILVAGIVGSVSPPGETARNQLTGQQVEALLTPRFPRMNLPDPAAFCGAFDRLPGDLLYSEFMHQWSGVAVLLLGLCWMLQLKANGAANWAARAWTGLLIPFGIFIAYASDPEVWLLHSLSFRQVLVDPQMVEHQLGALLIFVLAYFGWRDHHRENDQRPLGYALPVVMIGGSLLLLGHAHSTLNASDELTGRINVQHAILGGLGLFGGMTRWLALRRLVPNRLADWVWPGFVIALGLFLALYYRESV